MQQLIWNNEANGVWKATMGTGPFLDLLSQSGVAPKTDALGNMSDEPFPLDQQQITLSQPGEKLLLTLPLNSTEKLYGLGLNFKRLQVRKSIRQLHVDHYGGSDNGRTHAPVPFYVSSEGYGVFINLARYIAVYTGGTHRKENHPPVIDRFSKEWQDVQPGTIVEVAVPAPGAEVFIFAGPTTLDAVRRFNLYCGGGCMPPRWGLGFWHRVPMGFTADEAENEADDFAKRGFPLDVIGLEPGWHTQSYPTSYEWNIDRFPDPQRFVGDMKKKHVRINLWENPYIAPDCPLGKMVEPLCGSHTGGWGGIVPDLTLPEARDMFADQHNTTHLDLEISGYKLDECDGYSQWIWPDHATFPSGLSGEQLRQVYGLLYQRMTVEMFGKRNQRTYGLVRASNAGSVSFPYVIYNDCYEHRDFITGVCSGSFCGLLFTPEARSSETSEEWLRRIQAVSLSPLAMINAWADGTKPWSFDEVSDAVKNVMLLRMQLIPYIYTAFAHYHNNGTPPLRAMALTEGFFQRNEEYKQSELDSTSNPYSTAEVPDITDQYMLGDSLLVAPVFAGQTQRQIILPQGEWFDFYSGDYIATGPREITFTASLDQIPILVRNGGIVPLMPARLHVSAEGEKVDLELRHYGRADGTFDLYDDDGQTLDYEKGKFSWHTLSVRRDASGNLQGSVDSDNAASFTYDQMTWKFMTTE